MELSLPNMDFIHIAPQFLSRVTFVLLMSVIIVHKCEESPFPGYEFIPTTTAASIGALEKCGEGSQQGVKLCVPYHQCNGRTGLIDRGGSVDGFGIIDIRLGANPCPDVLDVCCTIPKNGNTGTPEPPVTQVPPITPPPRHEDLRCGIRQPNGIDFEITGATQGESQYGEFPWMVAILNRHFNAAAHQSLAICGGSLIAPNVVLTGAHCVHKYNFGDIKVRGGEWDTQTDKERLPYQERDVANIIIHEQFKPNTLFNDVALVILSEPFNRAAHIKPICLPPPGFTVESDKCFASGWGKDLFGREGAFQVILKKIELPIVPHQKCQESLRHTRLGVNFILDDSFTCAGGEAGKDTCTGDGGSPLVCPDRNNPDRYVQAGIVAWGVGCGENRIPGVYADVGKFRNWVDENMRRLNFDTSSYTV